MAVTLRNILQGSGNAGSAALDTAGDLFNRAFKQFGGAAETVQEGRKAKYAEDVSKNTQQLLSELRQVNDPNAVEAVKSGFLDQATQRYGDKFNRESIDTALVNLKQNVRDAKESDYQYGQKQLQRGLTSNAVSGLDETRNRVLGIEKTLQGVDPQDRGAVRARLLKESGIDANSYLENVYQNLPEGQRSGEQFVAEVGNDLVARQLGIDPAKIGQWIQNRKVATGQAAEEEAASKRSLLKYQAALAQAQEAGKPVADKDRLTYLREQSSPLVGERWNDLGTKDREELQGRFQNWMNAGLSNDQILDIVSKYGRGSSGLFNIGGGPDLDAMDVLAKEYQTQNAKAALQPQ